MEKNGRWRKRNAYFVKCFTCVCETDERNETKRHDTKRAIWVNKWTSDGTAVIPTELFATNGFCYSTQTHIWLFTITDNRTLKWKCAFAACNIYTHSHSHIERETEIPFYPFTCSHGRSPVCYHSLCMSTERIQNEQMNRHWIRSHSLARTKQLNTIQCNTNKHLTKPPLSLLSTTTTTTINKNKRQQQQQSTVYTPTTPTMTTTSYECQKM